MKKKFGGKGWAARKAGLVSDGIYDAASTGGEALALWHPSLRSADGEVLPNRDRVTARARDLERNNGWASGGLQKELDAVIGSTFRPIPKPDHVALGLSEDWATDWRQQVQARWRAYADDPRCYADAARQLTVSQNLGLAYRHAVLDGDAIGVLNWRPGRPNATVLRVVDPDLLSNPQDGSDSEFMRGGVEIDRDGAARAYHFRQAHERDHWASSRSFKWERVIRERRWGRPVVLHWFEKKRDGQTRGMSRLAPIIEKLKMEDRYARIELEAAALNAILAAFIKSPFDHTMLDQVLGSDGDSLGVYQDMRSESAKENAVTLGGVQIPRLFPGEDLGFQKAQRPATGFADFESAVLRNIAAGLGISYEQLAADWSKTNYSSARAALIEIWRGWTGKRHSFAQRFAQPLFMAWMEEEVDRGTLVLPTDAPDFYENWHSYARAKWIGPGRGFVDPVKEAQAAALRVASGMSTLEDEAAELTGADFDDNLAQIRREIASMPKGMLHPAQESFAKLLGHNGGPPMEDNDARR
jgi:lambda family phage portal protein